MECSSSLSLAGASTGLGGDEYYGYVPDLLGRVSETFERYGVPVDGDRVQLHQGLFEETWPRVADEVGTIAFAHIDCDWYDPVRYCLGVVAPRLATDGIIMLDDYFDYGGCRTAVHEFLEIETGFEFRHRGGNASLRRVPRDHTRG
jgi:O-methyltransferase